MTEPDAAPREMPAGPGAPGDPDLRGRPPRKPWVVWLKRVGCAVLALAMVCAGIVGWSVYRALRWFEVEDRMSGTCHLVAQAVSAYQEKHGKLPESLDQLVPEQLPSIPQAKEIQSVELRLSEDKRAWAVTVRSNFGGQPRIYDLSYDPAMPPPPNAREIGFFHGITVYLSTERETGAGRGRSP